MSSTISQRKQRHRARRLAMQALYQWHYNHMSSSDLIPAMLDGLAQTQFDKEYFQSLVVGTIDHIETIDTAMKPALDRDLTELNPVELAILRISMFELMHKIEVPYRVVINEGVELAKEFGSEAGHKFVNAVLDKLAAEYRQLEMQ